MKDPSGPSWIDVNKYFPQPRSMRIESKRGKRRRRKGRGKNQLVERFAKKTVAVVGVGVDEGERGGGGGQAG